MASLDVFVSNVKTLLRVRKITIRELAKGIGVSESYLSLMLSGARKSIKDEYKDKIVCYLNVSMSRLYSESFPTTCAADEIEAYESKPERAELWDLLDLFAKRSGTDHLRSAFRSALGLLSDSECLSVRRFILEAMAKSATKPRSESPLIAKDLSSDEQWLLAAIAMAGNNARVEWVKAVAKEENKPFETAVHRLQVDGIVAMVEDTDCLRIKTDEAFSYPPISSMFTRPKLQALYRTLAAAMQIHHDRGAEAEARLGEVLLHAASDSEAACQFEVAGRLFADRSAFHEGASYCQQAAVLFLGIGLELEWGRCLYEAAKCLCFEGNWDVAEELCSRVYSRFARNDRLCVAANICLGFGLCLLEHDEVAAEKWYRMGIGVCSPASRVYGQLLSNLASLQLQAERVEESTQTLDRLEKWIGQTRDSGDDDLQLSHIAHHLRLLRGVSGLYLCAWSSAEKHFRQYLDESSGEDAEHRAVALHNLGLALFHVGQTDEARACVQGAMEYYTSSHLKSLEFSALVDLARIALAKNDIRTVENLLARADTDVTKGPRRERGWVHLLRACLSRYYGRLGRAVEEGRKAVQIFESSGALRESAIAAFWTSHAMTEAADVSRARPFENRAFRTCQEIKWDTKNLFDEWTRLSPSSRAIPK